MTSKERVLSTFSHVQPDRVPSWFGSSVEFLEKAKSELGLSEEKLRLRFGDDFRRIFPVYPHLHKIMAHNDADMMTVFGIEREGLGYGQPTDHPLTEAGVREIRDFPWPDPESVDVSTLHTQAGRWVDQYAILGGEWSPFWHDAIDLIGMERLYVSMFDEPEIVDALFEKIVDFYARVNEIILETAGDVIDIVFVGNDFGSQKGPLLGPDLFERFITHHLERLVKIAHRYGKPFQLHCCGGFRPLMPILTRIGVDAFHAVQPNCVGMDLEHLKRDFGDSIVFNGAIDSQSILIEGTPETVRARTREVLQVMMPGGGYIAGASHDSILEETPVKNVLAMFDAVREFGVYKS